jgi:tetratricopeptide (TPR) repeat protein
MLGCGCMCSKTKQYLICILIILLGIYYLMPYSHIDDKIVNTSKNEKLLIIKEDGRDINYQMQINTMNGLKNHRFDNNSIIEDTEIFELDKIYKGGFWDKYRLMIEEKLKENPGDTELIVNLALVYKDLLMQTAFKYVMNDIIYFNKKNIEVYETLSNFLIDSSDNESAFEILYRGIDNNSDDPKYFFLLGDKLASVGKYEEAVEIYQRGIKINPNDHAAYYNLAIIYSSMNKQDMADQANSIARELLNQIESEDEESHSQ